jgi:hypothetical protein
VPSARRRITACAGRAQRSHCGANVQSQREFNYETAWPMNTHLNVLALALITLVIGCADNPVTPEEHFEARGVLVERTGLSGSDSTVVTVDTSHVSGAIAIDTVAAFAAFDVRFINEDGTIGLPPGAADATNPHDLAVSVADSTIAYPTAVTRWGFRLVGMKAGTTTLTVHLLHGGHDDYVSVAIPVQVER